MFPRFAMHGRHENYEFFNILSVYLTPRFALKLVLFVHFSCVESHGLCFNFDSCHVYFAVAATRALPCITYTIQPFICPCIKHNIEYDIVNILGTSFILLRLMCVDDDDQTCLFYYYHRIHFFSTYANQVLPPVYSSPQLAYVCCNLWAKNI